MHLRKPDPNFVICEYPLPIGGRTRTQVFCQPDQSDLPDILQRRGMGEVFIAQGDLIQYRLPEMPSEHFIRGKLGRTMHALIWVGMVLNHSDPKAGRDAMMDTGIIHEISHMVEDDEYTAYRKFGPVQQGSWGPTNYRLLQDIIALERSVPGLHPIYGLSEAGALAWEEWQKGEISGQNRETHLPKPKLFSLDDYARMSLPFLGLKDQPFKQRMLDDIILPTKTPLPNQRQFEMSRHAQGQTAKAKRIEAALAKLKKTPTPSFKTASPALRVPSPMMMTLKSQGTIMGIDPAFPGKKVGYAQMTDGKLDKAVVVGPAKPGDGALSGELTAPTLADIVKMFSGTDKPLPTGRLGTAGTARAYGMSEAKTKALSFEMLDAAVSKFKLDDEFTQMLKGFQATERLHRKGHENIMVFDKGHATINGQTYPLEAIKVNYADAGGAV